MSVINLNYQNKFFIMNKKTTTSKVYYLRFYSARKKRLQRGAGWEGKRDDLKKIWGSHIRRNFEGDDIIFFLNSQNWMCLPIKLKKTAVQQPLLQNWMCLHVKLKKRQSNSRSRRKPPFSAENWHFQAILDAFLMIMIQFFF